MIVPTGGNCSYRASIAAPLSAPTKLKVCVLYAVIFLQDALEYFTPVAHLWIYKHNEEAVHDQYRPFPCVHTSPVQ